MQNRIPRRALACLASILLAGSLGAGPSMPQCDRAADGSWVAHLRERILSFDALGLYAVEHLGAPTACRGAVTANFEGLEFGSLRLDFPEGAWLQADTFPPESSVVTLTRPGGFADEQQARRLLRDYTAGIGVEIDWSAPEIAIEGGSTVETYWDPDDGLNASARIVTTNSRITTLHFSMAL